MENEQIGAELFPNAARLFEVAPEPLERVIADCVFVLDTNALLVPYVVTPSSLSNIGDVYRKLRTTKRVFVPAQVAREFARLRASKLAELAVEIAKVRSDAGPRRLQSYPLLENSEGMAEARQLGIEAAEAEKKYRRAVGVLADRVAAWRWDDPVSLLYRELFTAECIAEPQIARDAFDKDLARRSEHKIPPGYKDAGKPDGGFGDLAIWHSILELGRARKAHLVFVTAEEKSDWWHRGDGPLFPRFELVEEYWRTTGGKSFHILTLSQVLELLKSSSEAVTEVRSEERFVVADAQSAAAADNVDDSAFEERIWLARTAVRRQLELATGTLVPSRNGAEHLYDVITKTGKRAAVRVEYREVERWFDSGRLLTIVRKASAHIASGDYDEYWLYVVSNSFRRSMILLEGLAELLPPTSGLCIVCGFMDVDGIWREIGRTGDSSAAP